jgi:hypothetical protein
MWACTACTYENEVARATCEMCGGSGGRPLQQSAAATTVRELSSKRDDTSMFDSHSTQASRPTGVSCPPTPPTAECVLVVRSPTCEWLGPGTRVVAAVGAMYTGEFTSGSGEKCNGRGTQIRVVCCSDGGSGDDGGSLLVGAPADRFVLDGPPDGLCVRLASDPAVVLVPDHGKAEAGNKCRCVRVCVRARIPLHVQLEQGAHCPATLLTPQPCAPASLSLPI